MLQRKSLGKGAFSVIIKSWTWARVVCGNKLVLAPNEAGSNPAGSIPKSRSAKRDFLIAPPTAKMTTPKEIKINCLKNLDIGFNFKF